MRKYPWGEVISKRLVEILLTYKIPCLSKMILSFSLFLFSTSALSGEVIQSHIKHKQGFYEAWLEMQIAAPSDKVYALFTDFNRLSRLSDRITESRLISGASPSYVVFIKTSGCVLFFCKDLQQTQRVLEIGDGHIMVEDIKNKSDFTYADTLWHIRTFENGTRVTFSTEMKPDFWLPPLLGPWLFKKRLIDETQAMINRMEQHLTNESN